MITPPVCVATYAASAIAESRPFLTGFNAMKLGFVAIVVPFIFVVKPPLLMMGTWTEVLVSLVWAVLGVLAFSVALEGYLFVGAIAWVKRIAFAAAGFCLFYPHAWLNLAGLALLMAATVISLPGVLKARGRGAVLEGG